jgi:HK97 gp10 family phage protein
MLKAKITGGKELERNLEKVKQQFSDKLEAAVKSGALVVQNDAKRRAPYRTGTLRRSIHMETIEKKRDRVEVLVGTDVEYAWRIEYGVYNQQPQPYLRPARDENKDEVQREIADALREALRGR